jgi:hypothetical protein
MIELVRTTDPVRLSFLRDALEGAGVDVLVFDSQSPWPGAIPGRLMVADEDAEIARRVIAEAERALP